VTSRDADRSGLEATLRWGYRPQIDGLRAVAVYLVVAFHAGIARFDGGFVGVDVFFVLSGYLVTQLLLRDLHAFGSVGLRRFYSRRFRRLLPAAFAVLLITAVVYAAIASPAEVLDATGAMRAAFLYVSNWYFIDQATDYFGPGIDASPVLHFWSLSVEEQFYACWPILLLGMYALTRRARHQWRVIRVVVALGAVGSAIAALRLADVNLNRAYYGTDTRAYQLLVGALIAMTPRLLRLGERHRRWMASLAAASLAVVVVLATSFVDLGPIERGLAIAISTAVLIVAIENSERGPVKAALSSAPIVYLGRISYATYLWHWLVVIVIAEFISISPLATFGITFLVATGLASLSYQLLERPVRESRLLDVHRTPVIAIGVAASVLGGLLVVPRLLDDPAPRKVAVSSNASLVGAAPVPSGLDWQAAKRDGGEFPECLGRIVADCTVVRGNGPHILLMGDSHAQMLIPLFTDIAERHSFSLSVLVQEKCPWQEELYYLYLPTEDCRSHKQDWFERVIPELDPDVVFLSHRPFDDPTASLDIAGPAGALIRGSATYGTGIRAASMATVDRLREEGRNVVVIEPIPMPPFDPIDCLSLATYLDQCRYVANQEATQLEVDYRSIADRETVWSLDLDPLVCPYLPICDPMVGGRVVKRDRGHLTRAYVRTFADDVEDYLRGNNIIEF
jgi:peptidoglycan/LPS O-acetylase OafA/YrhL